VNPNRPIGDFTLASPRSGYDEAAERYDGWRWSRFWRIHEAPRIVRWLERLPVGVGIDAGAGTGAYVNAYGRHARMVVAMDLSHEMLRLCRLRIRDAAGGNIHLNVVQGNVTTIPFPRAVFDWVLCCRVLSHVEQLELAMSEFARVLRSGAECLIADVHPDHPYSHVSIPTAKGRVDMETFKHPLMQLSTMASFYGLRLVSLAEVRLSDLAPPPPRNEFPKLFLDFGRPIFYVCRLRRD
jgi:ubiquinone/menaquinone biosynthesis C-methylase UbiE